MLWIVGAVHFIADGVKWAAHTIKKASQFTFEDAEQGALYAISFVVEMWRYIVLFIISVLLIVATCTRAKAQTFTFECLCDVYLSSADSNCDICSATLQNRLFSGMLIRKSGTAYKWIDAPYIVKASGNTLTFQELIFPNPETVSIGLTGTGYANIAAFMAAVECPCGGGGSGTLSNVKTLLNGPKADSALVSVTINGDTLKFVKKPVGDGNGIYGGSGTVPVNTLATYATRGLQLRFEDEYLEVYGSEPVNFVGFSDTTGNMLGLFYYEEFGNRGIIGRLSSGNYSGQLAMDNGINELLAASSSPNRYSRIVQRATASNYYTEINQGLGESFLRVDTFGIKFNRALMPNNQAGTLGQVLTSRGALTYPQWTNTLSLNTKNIYNTSDTLESQRFVYIPNSGLLNFQTVKNGLGGLQINTDAPGSAFGFFLDAGDPGNGYNGDYELQLSTEFGYLLSNESGSIHQLVGKDFFTYLAPDVNARWRIDVQGAYPSFLLYEDEIGHGHFQVKTEDPDYDWEGDMSIEMGASGIELKSENAYIDIERYQARLSGSAGGVSATLNVGGNGFTFTGVNAPWYVNGVVGSSGQVLTSQGAGNNPQWTTVSGGGGATDLSYTGSSSPVTLNSSTGTDVTISAGGIITLSATSSALTITATEVDGLATNEGALSVGAGGANTSLIQSNTSGSTAVTLSGGTGVTITEIGSTITIAATGSGGGGSIRSGRNGLVKVDTFLEQGGTFIQNTTLDQNGFKVDYKDGVFTHNRYNTAFTSNFAAFEVQGIGKLPDVVGTTEDAVMTLRSNNVGVSPYLNSLAFGNFDIDGEGSWIQSRRYDNHPTRYPLKVQPRGGKFSVGRINGLDAHATISAVGLTGSAVSGSVMHLENIEGSGNVKMSMGPGTDSYDAGIGYFDSPNATRVYNINTASGSTVRFAVGGEDQDEVVITNSGSYGRMAINPPLPASNADIESTLQVFGSIAGAALETFGTPAMDERKFFITYSGTGNVTWDLGDPADCYGRIFWHQNRSTAGIITYTANVRKAAGASFTTLLPGENAMFTSDGNEFYGFKITSN